MNRPTYSPKDKVRLYVKDIKPTCVCACNMSAQISEIAQVANIKPIAK